MLTSVKTIDKWETSYHYIKGFAMGAELPNLYKSLALAKRFHEGQFRKGGDPYIVHPLKVCSYLISLGIDDDYTLAAALLHDVVEDCDEISKDGHELYTKYGLDKGVVDLVLKLSKEKGYDNKVYYKNMEKDKGAILIKLSDRANNVSTMVGVFDEKKMKEYIEETEEYVLPLISYAKKYYPEISNNVTTMKYQIVAVCQAIDGMINIYNEKNKIKK